MRRAAARDGALPRWRKWARLLSGRQHCQWRYRELLVDPARSENQGMYGTSMRENREVPRSPVRPIAGRAAQGRPRLYV